MTTVVVIGAPGAGKGTRIEKAKEMISGLVSISTGNLIRKRGIDTSSGALISDDIIMEILSEELKALEANIVIFDGVPRNVQQAELMKKYGVNVDLVIELTISEKVAIDRALDRLVCPKCSKTYTKSDFMPPITPGICDICDAKLIQRPDDNPETVSERMRIYRKKTLPVLDWYKSEGVTIKTVDSEKDSIDFIKALTD